MSGASSGAMKRTVDRASRAGDSIVVICILVNIWGLLCHGMLCSSLAHASSDGRQCGREAQVETWVSESVTMCAQQKCNCYLLIS
jgi:hypothetical protein